MPKQQPQQPALRASAIEPATTAIPDGTQAASVFDSAAALMLQREESLLGDIITACSKLMTLANDQADEIADSLEEVL